MKMTKNEAFLLNSFQHTNIVRFFPEDYSEMCWADAFLNLIKHNFLKYNDFENNIAVPTTFRSSPNKNYNLWDMEFHANITIKGRWYCLRNNLK